MKRKTSTLPTRIYTYGCRLPTANGHLVEQQLLLAHRYYNTLIEIEKRRREKVRAAQSVSSLAVSQAEQAVAIYEAEIVGVLAVINVKKGAARSGKVDQKEERDVLAVLRELKKQTIVDLREAKKEARTPELLAEFKAIGELANAEVREARAKCGVYWGTYLLVERAVEDARKSREDPGFHRLAVVPNREGPVEVGHGRVGVELMNGASVALIMAGRDTRLQVDVPAPNGMSRARIRVGTVEGGREPIFADFPIRLHRPLPADGVVKWAWILKTLKGRWVNWELQIVVESASFVRPARPPSDGGVVALDIGWRRRPADVGKPLRVAYWQDDQGCHGELVLPDDASARVGARPRGVRGRLDQATILRSIADRNFDGARADLVRWRDEHELPEWLVEALEWLSAWKAPRKLGAVVDRWKGRRFAGDEEIYSRMVAWWKQQRHLYDWESCERDRALGLRKDVYRRWAAELTRRYAVVVLEDFDLSEVAKLQEPDSPREDLPAPTRRNRTVASCSEFVLALKSAAPGNGCTIDLEPCEDTTATCSRCGNVERFDHVPLEHKCERCGGESGPRDQDRNAAENLLAAYAGKQGRSRTSAQVSEIGGSEVGAVTMPAQGAVP